MTNVVLQVGFGVSVLALMGACALWFREWRRRRKAEGVAVVRAKLLEAAQRRGDALTGLVQEGLKINAELRAGIRRMRNGN